MMISGITDTAIKHGLVVFPSFLTEHLINKGYKNIAFVCAVTDKQQAARRIEGYKKAYKEYDITYKEELIAYCSQKKEDIFNTTVNLICTQDVDAIF